MEKSKREKEKAALLRQEKQYKRQNKHIAENYDRVSVTLPKGTKERIKNAGFSVNSFVNLCVIDKLEKIERLENNQ